MNQNQADCGQVRTPPPPYSDAILRAATPLEKDQPREIHTHMAMIEEELKSLSQELDKLSGQLQPILTPFPEKLSEPHPPAPAPPASPIGDVLHRYYEEIVSARRQIHVLRRSLAI